MDQAERDQEILSLGEPLKPEKPRMLDDAAAKQKVLDKFSEIRRKPGA